MLDSSEELRRKKVDGASCDSSSDDTDPDDGLDFKL